MQYYYRLIFVKNYKQLIANMFNSKSNHFRLEVTTKHVISPDPLPN